MIGKGPLSIPCARPSHNYTVRSRSKPTDPLRSRETLLSVVTFWSRHVAALSQYQVRLSWNWVIRPYTISPLVRIYNMRVLRSSHARHAKVRLAAIDALWLTVKVPDRAKVKGAGTAAIVDLVGFREENVLPVAAFFGRGDTTVNYLAEVRTAIQPFSLVDRAASAQYRRSTHAPMQRLLYSKCKKNRLILPPLVEAEGMVLVLLKNKKMLPGTPCSAGLISIVPRIEHFFYQLLGGPIPHFPLSVQRGGE